MRDLLFSEEMTIPNGTKRRRLQEPGDGKQKSSRTYLEIQFGGVPCLLDHELSHEDLEVLSSIDELLQDIGLLEMSQSTGGRGDYQEEPSHGTLVVKHQRNRNNSVIFPSSSSCSFLEHNLEPSLSIKHKKRVQSDSFYELLLQNKKKERVGWENSSCVYHTKKNIFAAALLSDHAGDDGTNVCHYYLDLFNKEVSLLKKTGDSPFSTTAHYLEAKSRATFIQKRLSQLCAYLSFNIGSFCTTMERTLKEIRTAPYPMRQDLLWSEEMSSRYFRMAGLYKAETLCQAFHQMYDLRIKTEAKEKQFTASADCPIASLSPSKHQQQQIPSPNLLVKNGEQQQQPALPSAADSYKGGPRRRHSGFAALVGGSHGSFVVEDTEAGRRPREGSASSVLGQMTLGSSPGSPARGSPAAAAAAAAPRQDVDGGGVGAGEEEVGMSSGDANSHYVLCCRSPSRADKGFDRAAAPPPVMIKAATDDELEDGEVVNGAGDLSGRRKLLLPQLSGGKKKRESTNKKKKRFKISNSAKDVLFDWMYEHWTNPYPSDEQKAKLCELTGLRIDQLNNWFVNTRVRVWKKKAATLNTVTPPPDDDDEKREEAAVSKKSGTSLAHHDNVAAAPSIAVLPGPSNMIRDEWDLVLQECSSSSNPFTLMNDGFSDTTNTS